MTKIWITFTTDMSWSVSGEKKTRSDIISQRNSSVGLHGTLPDQEWKFHTNFLILLTRPFSEVTSADHLSPKIYDTRHSFNFLPALLHSHVVSMSLFPTLCLVLQPSKLRNLEIHMSPETYSNLHLCGAHFLPDLGTKGKFLTRPYHVHITLHPLESRPLVRVHSPAPLRQREWTPFDRWVETAILN